MYPAKRLYKRSDRQREQNPEMLDNRGLASMHKFRSGLSKTQLGVQIIKTMVR